MVTTGEPRWATIYRFSGIPQGMMEEGLESKAFQPRKPLIQQKQLIVQQRASAHRIAPIGGGASAGRFAQGV